MSKVRIYELAKEAGLKSKELADKLIELGYPIKSHSSTVDDELAEDIRRKVIGSAVAEVTASRIEVKKPTVSAGAKTTVVRRRSKAEKEEIARKAEEEEAIIMEAEAEALQSSIDEEAMQTETAAPKVESSEAAIDAAAIDEAGRGERAAEPEAGEAEEGISLKQDQTDDYGADEASGEMVKQADGMKKKQEVPEAAVQRPKGLAKVVGMVDIQQVSEERPKPPKKTQRPRSGGAKVQRVAPAQVVTAPDEGAKAGKGKKKGKRIVSIHSQDSEDRLKKSGKAGKKGRRGGDFIRGADGDIPRYRKGQRKSKKDKAAQVVAETKAIKKRIKVFETISVGDLAKRMGVKASEIISRLMGLGLMATVNQALDIDTATLVATDFGYEVEQGMTDELEVIQLQENEEGGEQLPRPPVITVMGHVDHGKTSILDAIRKTDVAAGEAGGITQHIGAYHVQSPSGDLVFVDTPGHAAFTEMRSRGAQVTDIVILVVAADDGVMDQTKEAIAHAKAAEVPIVVAVNKIDKDNADPDRVKRELSDHGLMPEDWGGDTMYCHTSAKQNIGIDELLEAIQLQAEILELKADPTRKARGTVIEAQLHKGRGPVATVLVQEGTLQVGDFFVAGAYSGKVRSLTSDKGGMVKQAGPSTPVEVQGLSGVPQAGDEFIVVTDEKMAKSVSESRQLKVRELELAAASKVSLDNLFEKMAEQQVKELRVILRSDVQGTLEAFTQATEKLSTKDIRVRVLHEGTGSITENDIHLASASDAIIIGFNVRPMVKVKELAEQEKVDIRTYNVIYHALEDIEKAMVGMLEPTFEERVIGTVDVRQVFHVPKIGTIAGCMVVSGKVERNSHIRVLREGVVVYTGKLGSLRRFKDDAKEVLSGFECGIGVENFNDIKVGDTLEAFVMDEVEATL